MNALTAVGCGRAVFVPVATLALTAAVLLALL
jgi:hypothetical protein